MPKPLYPQSIIEFQQWFPDEQACIDYLYKTRWPDGFKCPICGDTEAYYISSRRLFQCKSNKHQTYLTAGTVMQGTRTSLLTWFWAAYLLTTETPGISSIQLQRQLKIRFHETAFNILHKLRAAMVNPFRDKIGSVVEVDETYIGGPTTGGKRGRGTKKAIVIVAVEIKKTAKGKRIAGRLRLRHIKDASEQSVIPFIRDSVTKNSTIITDAFKSYSNLEKYGYKHKPIIQRVTGRESSLPMAHIVFSNLKSWLKGTFHGVSSKHLQAYLNEFVFRFNRRFYPMAGFQTLLGLSSKVEYPTYKGLYSGEWKHPNPRQDV
jgi:transposase-like protein